MHEKKIDGKLDWKRVREERYHNSEPSPMVDFTNMFTSSFNGRGFQKRKNSQAEKSLISNTEFSNLGID